MKEQSIIKNYIHMIRSPSDTYTECGNALDKLCGSFIPSAKATKDVAGVTCPLCKTILLKETEP